jgi:ComEC/Rec2-related protein
LIITKQPLLFPLLGLVTGILAGYWFKIPLFLPAIFILILLSSFLVINVSGRIIAVLILAAFGAFNYTWQIKTIKDNDLRKFFGDNPAHVVVTGKVSGIPTIKVIPGKQGKNTEVTRFVLDVESLQFRRSVTNISVKGEVLTIIRGKISKEISDGSNLTIYGIIKPPPESRIYGTYDYREDLKNKGIFYMLIVDSPSDIEVNGEVGAISLKQKFIEWTDRILRYGLPEKLSETDLRTAMLFGFKTKISDEYRKDFIYSGTMHLFAVSGIHVAIISGAILTLLMSFNLSRQVCGLITLPMLWFFTAVTGWQASAIRAAIMITILIGSWILNRPSDLLNSLYAAAIVILVWEPSQLFQASFQLSFVAVLSLSLIIPVYQKSLRELLKTDPFLPFQLVPGYKKVLINSANYLGSALITSMAAFIGSTPLIAKYFNIVSPVSIFGNLIVIPLGTLCLISTMASIIFGTFCLPLTEIFNWSGWLLSRCMIELTNIFSNAGFGWFYIKCPTTEQIISFYVLWLVLLIFFTTSQNRWIVTAIITACVLFLIGSFVYEKNQTEVDVISFERGHAVYVQDGYFENALIDCGTVDDVRMLIEPLLISRGANWISSMFLTHGDINHVGGAIELSEKYFIRDVFASGIKQRSRYYLKAIEHFDNNGRLRLVSYPQRVGKWEIISPDESREYKRADDAALVLRGCFGKERILLMSDVSMETINCLMESPVDLKSDILIGSVLSVGRIIKSGCLELIKPDVIIIAERGSYGKYDDFNQMIKEAVNKRIKVYWVGSFSGLTLKMRNGSYSVMTTENISEFLPEMNDL